MSIFFSLSISNTFKNGRYLPYLNSENTSIIVGNEKAKGDCLTG